MADPTLGLTFDDYCIRVAEFLGIAYYGAAGDQSAQLPTDVHDLDLVRRLVNDGYRRFLTESDRWNFMNVPLTITFGTGLVGTDLSRYYLPDDFYGVMTAPFTYAANQGFVAIDLIPEPMMRELEATNNSSGLPTVATFRPINTTETSTTQRWEMIFYPKPGGTQVVTGRYRRFPNKMTTGTNRSVAGVQHDTTVMAACLAAAEEQRNDLVGVKEDLYQKALSRSVRLDLRATPRRRVYFGDGSDGGRGPRQRPLSFYGVDSVGGTSIDPA